MRDMFVSIAAEADVPRSEQIGIPVGRQAANKPLAESLPAHQFPARRDPDEASSDRGIPAQTQDTAASRASDDFFAEEYRRRRTYRNR